MNQRRLWINIWDEKTKKAKRNNHKLGASFLNSISVKELINHKSGEILYYFASGLGMTTGVTKSYGNYIQFDPKI